MARRETPLDIKPPTQVPTWDQLTPGARRAFLAHIDKTVRRLEAEGLPVWLPATAEHSASD